MHVFNGGGGCYNVHEHAPSLVEQGPLRFVFNDFSADAFMIPLLNKELVLA